MIFYMTLIIVTSCFYIYCVKDNKNNINLEEKLKVFAIKEKLEIIPTGFFTGPIFKGKFRNFPFTMCLKKDSITIDLYIRSGIPFYFHIYPNTFPHSLMKSLGLYYIETGNPIFDRAFITNSGGDGKITDIITEDLQKKLLSFKNLEILFAQNNLYCGISKTLLDAQILEETSNIIYEVAINISQKEISDKKHNKDKKIKSLEKKSLKTCPSCKSKVPAGKKFCIMCGKKFM